MQKNVIFIYNLFKMLKNTLLQMGVHGAFMAFNYVHAFKK
jgi:hypothetical protein